MPHALIHHELDVPAGVLRQLAIAHPERYPVLFDSAADGPLSRDYRRIPYTKVQRPIWPLDAETSPGLIL